MLLGEEFRTDGEKDLRTVILGLWTPPTLSIFSAVRGFSEPPCYFMLSWLSSPLNRNLTASERATDHGSAMRVLSEYMTLQVPAPGLMDSLSS